MDRRTLLRLLGASALSACAPSDRLDGSVDTGIDSGVPGVTVNFGTGQIDYLDVPRTGATLELIYGVQGGYHVWGRAQFHGFAPDVDVSFNVVDQDSGRTLHIPNPARRRIENGVRYGLTDAGNGTYQTDAELVIVSIVCASDVVGHTLVVDVFVRERASNRTAADRRVVRIIDEVNPQSCVPG